ncbi:hypothetical protein LguiB_026287 [Lonicera macranthoides]
MAGVKKVKLGSQGLVVSKQGLGCMGMSAFFGPPKPDEEMIPLIHHAIDSGVTFLDTSDFYGPHINETLVGKALKGGYREKVQLASKFGVVSFIDGIMNVCGDPAYVRASCEASLERLQVDCIDLYYQHRVDASIPIEITMGALKKLVEEGKIKYVGLSEVPSETIRRAHAVHPLTAIQLEWSLWCKDVEDDIVPTCRELGIGIVPYSPVGQGFFCLGSAVADDMNEDDLRTLVPRFQPGNIEPNGKMFDKIKAMAKKRGYTAAQISLAWVHHKGDDVVPIPGTTNIDHFNEILAALSIKLTPEEIKELEYITSEEKIHGGRFEGMISWQESYTVPLESWKPRN